MSDRSTTEFSFNASKKANSTSAASSFRIPPGKHRKRGSIIAAGNGTRNDEGERVSLDITAGDTILFGKYSGQKVKLDGVEYLIMKENDVLAAIDDVSIAKDARRKR